MKHFASHWTDYHIATEPLKVGTWVIKSGSRVAHAATGDAMWLFANQARYLAKNPNTSDLYDGDHSDNLALLLQVFRIHKVGFHTKDDRFLRVYADPDSNEAINPPMKADDLFRPPARSKDRPIGLFRQGGWQLSQELSENLMKELQGHAHKKYVALFG